MSTAQIPSTFKRGVYFPVTCQCTLHHCSTELASISRKKKCNMTVNHSLWLQFVFVITMSHCGEGQKENKVRFSERRWPGQTDTPGEMKSVMSKCLLLCQDRSVQYSYYLVNRMCLYSNCYRTRTTSSLFSKMLTLLSWQNDYNFTSIWMFETMGLLLWKTYRYQTFTTKLNTLKFALVLKIFFP